MAELIAVPLEDGGAVIMEIVEVVGQPDGGVVKAGRPGDGLTRAAKTLDAALEPVAAAAKAVLGKLREAGPDEVSVEFGVRFATELGAVITRSTGECNLKVTVRWGRAE